MVMQRWCVKDGVLKMVCDKAVCQRWWVTKRCVKDGASKMVCDKVVCESCVQKRACDKVVCQRWCESQPSAASATPATQSEGECHVCVCV